MSPQNLAQISAIFFCRMSVTLPPTFLYAPYRSVFRGYVMFPYRRSFRYSSLFSTELTVIKPFFHCCLAPPIICLKSFPHHYELHVEALLFVLRSYCWLQILNSSLAFLPSSLSFDKDPYPNLNFAFYSRPERLKSLSAFLLFISVFFFFLSNFFSFHPPAHFPLLAGKIPAFRRASFLTLF